MIYTDYIIETSTEKRQRNFSQELGLFSSYTLFTFKN